MDTAAAIAQTIKDQIASSATKTARGTVVATATDGFVTFTVGGLSTPRKGVWVGPGVPQVGAIITYIDEGRGIPLVLGPTGPQDLSISATKSVIVGNTTVSTAGVTTTGTFVDGSGNLRAAVNALLPSAWTVLSLTGGWSNYGGGFASAAYRKSGDVVQMRGLVVGGTIGGAGVGTAICTLPSGFRPPYPMIFATIAGNALGRINITTGGTTSCEVGTNTFVSLDGINFSITA